MLKLNLNFITFSQYVVVLDAGSSGTRLTIFSWPSDYSPSSDNSLNINHQLTYCTTTGYYFNNIILYNI